MTIGQMMYQQDRARRAFYTAQNRGMYAAMRRYERKVYEWTLRIEANS